ncbi:MAG: hypothetical protein JNL71_06205 [Rhodospirillales bacterium]|nr:hypothetical protein [Rhodospirillales bacterium]
MTMEVVNGIPCFNCTDVEKAKKSPPPESSTLDVALAAASGHASGPRPFQTPNDPLALGERGRIFNFGA